VYVCICNKVSDRQIRQAVRRGARRMRDLRETLGVASECGKCAGCAREVLREALAQEDPGVGRSPTPAFDPA
jgi:bacterioferritin-associated ferredoxin